MRRWPPSRQSACEQVVPQYHTARQALRRCEGRREEDDGVRAEGQQTAPLRTCKQAATNAGPLPTHWHCLPQPALPAPPAAHAADVLPRRSAALGLHVGAAQVGAAAARRRNSKLPLCRLCLLRQRLVLPHQHCCTRGRRQQSPQLLSTLCR